MVIKIQGQLKECYGYKVDYSIPPKKRKRFRIHKEGATTYGHDTYTLDEYLVSSNLHVTKQVRYENRRKFKGKEIIMKDGNKTVVLPNSFIALNSRQQHFLTLICSDLIDEDYKVPLFNNALHSYMKVYILRPEKLGTFTENGFVFNNPKDEQKMRMRANRLKNDPKVKKARLDFISAFIGDAEDIKELLKMQILNSATSQHVSDKIKLEYVKLACEIVGLKDNQVIVNHKLYNAGKQINALRDLTGGESSYIVANEDEEEDDLIVH
jgi:hypothetical protein